MTDSRRIAGLLGPTLIALTASEVVTSGIWATVPATQTYLAGCLWFVAGLSIVRAHNRWRGGWPVMVTAVGWFAILGGLFRMFAPAFLTFKAFSGEQGPTVSHSAKPGSLTRRCPW